MNIATAGLRFMTTIVPWVIGLVVVGGGGAWGFNHWYQNHVWKYRFKVHYPNGNTQIRRGKLFRNEKNSDLKYFKIEGFFNMLETKGEDGFIVLGKILKRKVKLFHCTVTNGGDITYLKDNIQEDDSKLYVPINNAKLVERDVIKWNNEEPTTVKKKFYQFPKKLINRTNIEDYELDHVDKERMAYQFAQAQSIHTNPEKKMYVATLMTMGIIIFLLAIAVGWQAKNQIEVVQGHKAAAITSQKTIELQKELLINIMESQEILVDGIRDFSGGNVTFSKKFTAK